MARRSGIITVTTAGTAVAGTDTQLAGKSGSSKLVAVYIKALASNTGVAYVGNDGASDVASTTGYPLEAGEQVLVYVQNLNELYFDAAVSGEGVAWLLAG